MVEVELPIKWNSLSTCRHMSHPTPAALCDNLAAGLEPAIGPSLREESPDPKLNWIINRYFAQPKKVRLIVNIIVTDTFKIEAVGDNI